VMAPLADWWQSGSVFQTALQPRLAKASPALSPLGLRQVWHLQAVRPRLLLTPLDRRRVGQQHRGKALAEGLPLELGHLLALRRHRQAVQGYWLLSGLPLALPRRQGRALGSFPLRPRLPALQRQQGKVPRSWPR
jgi:hypothetical protein